LKAEEFETGKSSCAFIRLRAHLGLRDAAGAINEIKKLPECADFDAGHLRYACTEALQHDMDDVAICALHVLHGALKSKRAAQRNGPPMDESCTEAGGRPSYTDNLTEATLLRCLLKLAIARLEKDSQSPATAKNDPGSICDALKYDQVDASLNMSSLMLLWAQTQL
jgi:hypothetical protein